MTGASPTLMLVHAHPDDEATQTGGILAKYSAEGVRTVLVTCTNGELGDGPGGVKPEDDEHDEAAVVAMRKRELEESCRILGVKHLEMLGFHDSGMQGWSTNEAAGAFANLAVEEAARPLAALMRRYEPDVVVTYDAFGFYGHPDHIQAHGITLAALDMVGSTARLWFNAIRRSSLAPFRERMKRLGIDPPDVDEERFGAPDDQIAATIDCREYGRAKLQAVRAHASQSENLFFLRFSDEEFINTFAIEEFVLGRGSAEWDIPADDLFVGLRSRVAT